MLPLANGRDAAVRVSLDVPPTSTQATDALHAIRGLRVANVDALATSPAARLIDLRATLSERLPWATLIICGATFVVLFLAFGSVVMPIKAIIMTVLSLTASFGALVWIFQDGRFESLLNFESPGTIELTIPLVMFAVVFGLAMDYELFLLSRIREAYDRTHDTHASVTIGLERTATIITRAAMLLVAVMIGFATADMLLVKELGVGMAIAVVVDATIVRALLVPATMQLLGHYNWWAPAPLAALWKRMHMGVDERGPEELGTGPAEQPGE
jgi:RND superfamily putative drug exporter